jgi:hypothetical protein
MNRKVVVRVLCALLALGSLAPMALADDRGREGTVVGIDKDAMLFIVRSGDGDQWTVTWATGSDPLGDLDAKELRLFDRIRFGYREREGVNWLTELDRSSKQ